MCSLGDKATDRSHVDDGARGEGELWWAERDGKVFVAETGVGEAEDSVVEAEARLSHGVLSFLFKLSREMRDARSGRQPRGRGYVRLCQNSLKTVVKHVRSNELQRSRKLSRTVSPNLASLARIFVLSVSKPITQGIILAYLFVHLVILVGDMHSSRATESDKEHAEHLQGLSGPAGRSHRAARQKVGQTTLSGGTKIGTTVSAVNIRSKGAQRRRYSPWKQRVRKSFVSSALSNMPSLREHHAVVEATVEGEATGSVVSSVDTTPNQSNQFGLRKKHYSMRIKPKSVTGLGDVGTGVGAEGRAILEKRLTERRREAEADRLDRRNGHALGGRSIRGRSDVEKLHSTALEGTQSDRRRTGVVIPLED
ncbi:hypothetical protein KCU81_g7189, partial [Aureobasidium melanogenum]|uniref:Uncharacterized protein n=1 Tax=Aureobasidium melanogenum (strain CBS 110374) TaxID=1043003 RepID=A0A074VE65_AURM1